MALFFKSSDSVKLYRRLFTFIGKYWWAFVIAILGNLMYSGVDSGFVYLLKPILNKGFIARDMRFIKFLPYLILGAFIARGMASLIANYFMALVSRGVIMDFRQRIFHQLMHLPATFYDNTTTGRILSTILYNVEQVASAGSDSITTLAQSFFYIVGLLVVMFTISWKMSLFFWVAVPFIAIIIKISSKRLRKISTRLQHQMGEVTNIAEEAVEGYKVVRSFGGQAYEVGKFNKATDRNRLRELKMVITKSLSVSIVQLVTAIVLCVMLYLATSPHHMGLSAGGFSAIVAAMLALLKPLKNFTNVNTRIQRGLAGAESVFETLDLPIEEDAGTKPVERVQGYIQFKDVSFTYPKTEKEILHSINFKSNPGQIIALVGRSGSGKTTLINLLQRFYTGASGTLTIDNVSIHEYKLLDFRKQFATVSQNVTLFNDTIANNIAYGRFKEASQEEIITAAKAANAWEFIQEMPEQLNTLIGEDGVLLSGGQRQRIAIARAILKNAPILILDEATSSLDTESERQIQNALDHLMRERTTLVIAHRLSTIENADLILVMDHGQIVETGNHKELIQIDGHYAKLHKMQFRDL